MTVKSNLIASDTYLKFIRQDGTPLLVAISDIFTVGMPIDPESGDDLPMDSEYLLNRSGEIIQA